MTFSVSVVDLKGDIFGRTMVPSSLIIIAFVLAFSYGEGDLPLLPAPEDEKKPGLERVKNKFPKKKVSKSPVAPKICGVSFYDKVF